MNRGSFAIIGCQHAHIGIFIGEMLALGYRCAGLYEPDNKELAEAMAAQHGIRLADTMEELLGPDVEIVGCAAINLEKIEVIERCEEAGKHVMVDKPAVTTTGALERLKAVVERGRIQVGMLLTERFRPSVQALKACIDRGELGDLVHVAMRKPHRLNPGKRPKWHFPKEENGGIVIDLLIHDVDLVRWLTGEELASMDGFATKTGYPEYPDFYDSASVQTVTGSGVTAQLYADWYTPEKSWTWGDCRIFVAGTKGSAELRLEGDPLVADEDLLLVVTDREPLRRIQPEEPPVGISEDFVNRLAGKPSVLGHEDILRASELVLACDRNVSRIQRPRSE
ncbi:oxidoreductase [Paenibacillus sp. J31TS4]|uniref:Gfo/Idh/MocA family protein n=1 Tax=Paenibacillus sp. J31TS4 TaxID=2807195 RepID=UPI001B18E8C9|nr:Gfo/Idh/MocA family oxidoreductase [Paenibacillus sp. J31TS4]GIP37646.1 oxidoreductase [Paenibacillus sp. J31TS4]